ncbi:MAG TPA: hypothetical protein PKA63_08845 [Oligoflexia bacterium]|nr:hypothetical protein [Oligoflexia bacterium]HMP48758.1 hypothetical protein [Oligoflexia bacterium]
MSNSISPAGLFQSILSETSIIQKLAISLFFPILIITSFVIVPVTHAELFKYEDAEGRTHYVDSADKIPEKYRDQLKTQPSFPSLSKVIRGSEESSGSVVEDASVDVLSSQVPPQSAVAEKKKLELFVADWCSHCRSLEATLKSEGVAYERFDIEKSDTGKRVYNELGRGGIPIARIDGRTIIRGNRPGEIKDAIR